MDLQRAAGQGEAKAQQNPQPQGPPVGFGVRFRIASASRTLHVHAGWGLMPTTSPCGRMATTHPDCARIHAYTHTCTHTVHTYILRGGGREGTAARARRGPPGPRGMGARPPAALLLARLRAPKAPCGFCSALSHRLGQPRATRPRRLGRMLTTFSCGQMPTTCYRL